jgi:DNA-binding NarL/FixJ family response regulator
MQAKVVVVDQVPTSREGLAVILERSGFEVHRPVRPELWLRSHHADGAVLTVHAAAQVEELRALRQQFPQLVVVAILLTAELAAYRRILRSGAHAAVKWDCSPERIAQVVQSALSGWTVIPTFVARSLVEGLPEGLWREALKPEEIEWLRALAQGASVAQLARTASYSQREMFRRLADIYERMGVGNRAEAIALAGQWGLITHGGHESLDLRSSG